MNKALLAVALLAGCSTYYYDIPEPHPTPDARSIHDSAVIVDASPDAATPLQIAPCNMGNLPTSRTTTHIVGDPVDPNLIDEIQDAIIGSKRKPFIRRFFPRFTVPGPAWGAPASVVAGGLSFAGVTSTGISATPGRIEIPHEVGDRLIGLSWQACGNGVADIVIDAMYSPTYLSPPSPPLLGTLTDLNRSGAAWSTATMVIGTPTVVVDGSNMEILVLAQGAAGYTIGMMSGTFDRL